MANHSKAPWTLANDVEIFAADGQPIACLAGGRSRTEHEANAALFLAAPKLLEGIKDEHGWDDQLHRIAQPDCWKCAAIFKAEGGKTNG